MADDQDDDQDDVIVVKHVRRTSLPRLAPHKQNRKTSNGNGNGNGSAKRLRQLPSHLPQYPRAQQDDAGDTRKRRKHGLRRRNLQTAQDGGPGHVLEISSTEEEIDNTIPNQGAAADHGRMTMAPNSRSVRNKKEEMDGEGGENGRPGVEQDDPECAYCLEPLSSAECLVLRACNHKLHRACFDLFPGNTATCCVCNQKSEEVIIID